MQCRGFHEPFLNSTALQTTFLATGRSWMLITRSVNYLVAAFAMRPRISHDVVTVVKRGAMDSMNSPSIIIG